MRPREDGDGGVVDPHDVRVPRGREGRVQPRAERVEGHVAVADEHVGHLLEHGGRARPVLGLFRVGRGAKVGPLHRHVRNEEALVREDVSRAQERPALVAGMV